MADVQLYEQQPGATEGDPSSGGASFDPGDVVSTNKLADGSVHHSLSDGTVVIRPPGVVQRAAKALAFNPVTDALAGVVSGGPATTTPQPQPIDPNLPRTATGPGSEFVNQAQAEAPYGSTITTDASGRSVVTPIAPPAKPAMPVMPQALVDRRRQVLSDTTTPGPSVAISGTPTAPPPDPNGVSPVTPVAVQNVGGVHLVPSQGYRMATRDEVIAAGQQPPNWMGLPMPQQAGPPAPTTTQVAGAQPPASASPAPVVQRTNTTPSLGDMAAAALGIDPTAPVPTNPSLGDLAAGYIKSKVFGNGQAPAPPTAGASGPPAPDANQAAMLAKQNAPPPPGAPPPPPRRIVVPGRSSAPGTPPPDQNALPPDLQKALDAAHTSGKVADIAMAEAQAQNWRDGQQQTNISDRQQYEETQKSQDLVDQRLDAITKASLQRATPDGGFWESRSTGQRIAGAIAVALGGAATAFGGKDSGGEIIKTAIQNSVNAQDTNLKQAWKGASELGATGEQQNLVNAAQDHHRDQLGVLMAENAVNRLNMVGAQNQVLMADPKYLASVAAAKQQLAEYQMKERESAATVAEKRASAYASSASAKATGELSGLRQGQSTEAGIQVARLKDFDDFNRIGSEKWHAIPGNETRPDPINPALYDPKVQENLAGRSVSGGGIAHTAQEAEQIRKSDIATKQASEAADAVLSSWGTRGYFDPAGPLNPFSAAHKALGVNVNALADELSKAYGGESAGGRAEMYKIVLGMLPTATDSAGTAAQKIVSLKSRLTEAVAARHAGIGPTPNVVTPMGTAK